MVECRFCKVKTEVVITYKHYWYCCPKCQCAFRKKRKKYPSEQFPLNLMLAFGLMLKRLFGKKTGFPYYYPNAKMSSDKSLMYEYYSDFEKNKYECSKWKKYDDEFIEFLNSAGIVFDGQEVLSVSDGPGAIAVRLKEKCKSFVVTEFNSKAVKLMKEKLGIEVVRYDFAVDNIEDVVSQRKFDLIFFRSCIEFCQDVEALLNGVKKILKPGGKIYVLVHPYSLGHSVRWMFDEYTSFVFFSPKKINEFFENAGYQQIHENEKHVVEELLFKKDTMSLKDAITFGPFMVFYYFRAILFNRKINFSLKGELHHFFYQKK